MVNGTVSKDVETRKRTRQDINCDEILLETEPGEVPWEDDPDDVEVNNQLPSGVESKKSSMCIRFALKSVRNELR